MARGPYYSPGKYWAKIVNQALGQTKTDKPQFVLTFIVMGQIDPADPEGPLVSCDQQERSVFRVITDKTIDYLLEDLAVLEFEGSNFADLRAADFKGKELAVRCEHETYEGNVKERWSVARSGGGLEVKPLDDKQFRQLESMFGKHLKAAAKPKPAASQQNGDAAARVAATREEAASLAGEDISPF